MLYVGKVISFLLLPPGLCVVCFLLGMALLLVGLKAEKARRTGMGLMVLGALLFIVCSLNPVADILIRPLEDRYPALAPTDAIEKADYEDCCAVVILGGGNVERSPEEGINKSSPSAHALKRIAYGTRLAKSLGLPVIFAGGVVYPHQGGEAEAPAAERYLLGLGIDAAKIKLDSTSKSTWENAKNVKSLVAGEKPEASKIIVVSSAFHMKRVVLSFEKQGMTVVPAPTDYLATRVPLTWEAWFPDCNAMEKTNNALHEYLGLFAYSLRPKVTAER
jgi:uncharacterized SAM-binding protein YcdF (DUF218 family)